MVWFNLCVKWVNKCAELQICAKPFSSKAFYIRTEPLVIPDGKESLRPDIQAMDTQRTGLHRQPDGLGGPPRPHPPVYY